MACDDFLNDVERLLNGTLEPEAEEKLNRHLEECPSCAASYAAMLADDNLLKEFAAGHADSVQRIEQGVISSLEERRAAQANVVPLWRKMMNNVGIRIAAMFVVAFGVAIIFNLFAPNPDIDFNAWDRVSANVQNASAISWHGTLTDDRGERIEMRNWISKDYGFRNDMWSKGKLVATNFYDVDTKELYAVIYPGRSYFILPLDFKEIYDATEGTDVRQMFDQLLKLEHKEIGTRRINGRLAVGIEVTDATFEAGEFDTATARLWVDPDTEWPVRMEIEGSAAGGRITNNIVMDEFKWDEVEASDFEVKIPDNFRLVFRADPIVNDEEHALEGLRAYAELTNKYPSELNPRTAMYEYRAGDRSAFGNDSDVKVMRIISSCAFFKTISLERMDARYYGDVEPGDAGKVLLRWRVDESTYRVIFGDLSVENFDSAELEQLEK